MRTSTMKLSTIASGNAVATTANRWLSRSGGNRFGARYTISAPAVRPNIATDSATNAKW